MVEATIQDGGDGPVRRRARPLPLTFQRCYSTGKSLTPADVDRITRLIAQLAIRAARRRAASGPAQS